MHFLSEVGWNLMTFSRLVTTYLFSSVLYLLEERDKDTVRIVGEWGKVEEDQ